MREEIRGGGNRRRRGGSGQTYIKLRQILLDSPARPSLCSELIFTFLPTALPEIIIVNNISKF
jgi:hypothetical protein